MVKKAMVGILIGLSLVVWLHAEPLHAARLKDIGYFLGSRSNQLMGYGLVVGLNGTGDKTKTQFTVNTLANLLDKMGIHVDPATINVKNIAAVMVTANLPPFLKSGSKLDVQVSSTGDAKSLQGGTLLMTPLHGPDGNIYAVAQGPISLGGFSFSGSSGSSVAKNHPTVGFISAGALIEKEVPNGLENSQQLDLVLNSPDFTTASEVAQVINKTLNGPYAQAQDAASIKLQVPAEFGARVVELISKVENLEIQPQVVAKVVINERTGTVVMGENVRISPVAIAHGNLTVQISETPQVVQPAPFSKGQTAVQPQTNIQATENKAYLNLVGGGTTIAQVIKGLNAIGVSPRDLITILQAIKAAGALQAELEII